MAEDGEDRLEFIQETDEKYNLQDLLSSDAKLMGKGNLGNTYKAFLKIGEVVAVKRFKGQFAYGISKENLQELGQVSHENLLPFKAYMFSKHQQLLVYDYMPMGSLYSLLHGGKDRTNLNWKTRMKVAYGVACGIDHIHKRGRGVCHGNIRSSNIFLDESCVVKISEFGIPQLFGKVKMSSEYRAPEVKRASQQGDVYSFGVLVLELCTGKDLVNEEEGFSLAKWVRLMFQENAIIDVFYEGLRVYNKKKTGMQMVQLLELAICCTFENPKKRPLISAVVKRIEEVLCLFISCSKKSQNVLNI
ncbi:hypothetical protein L2E82_13720 [Cichorium intybus]|uniref:Uncharacterized protein n=1 Tax=Cichorium intybus TaxID=13427 RepID=A0ACB9EY22_CICIN|nr:hypothetical protein L2E82_13720 [Cichorium intybus]